MCGYRKSSLIPSFPNGKAIIADIFQLVILFACELSAVIIIAVPSRLLVISAASLLVSRGVRPHLIRTPRVLSSIFV